MHLPSVPKFLKQIAITPTSPSYARQSSSYMKVGTPQLIFMIATEAQAIEAVNYSVAARKKDASIPFSVRSGGHGISGSSVNQGGIIFDLSTMNEVKCIDEEKYLFQIQAGAIWGDVAAFLEPYGVVITSGNFGDTGVGGLATAGGIGYFVRALGLTIDSVRAIRALTSDGLVRWVDDINEPELFWALRGGGSQAGIALEFIIQATSLNGAQKTTEIIQQTIQYTTSDLVDFILKWGEWVRTAPRELTSFLMLQQHGKTAVIQATNVWANNKQEAGKQTLIAAQTLAPVVNESQRIAPYARIVPTPRAPHVGQQSIQLRNVLVDVVDEKLARAMAAALAHPAVAIGELRSLGGAVSDFAPETTAWSGRSQEALAALWLAPAPEAQHKEAFAPLLELGTGMYAAYTSDTSSEVANYAWPGKTGERLQSTAKKYDKAGLFKTN